MHACLQAISGYLPEQVLANDDLSAIFPDIRMEDLTRLTGVKSRHLAAPGETAVDMAIAAAGKLFAEHAIKPDEVDFVLLNTQWPDYITPTSACIIQDRLEIPSSAGTLDISQGCTGYIYGLSVAKGLIESGSATGVLLLTSDTITRSIHADDHSNRAIFGDGATASFIHASEGTSGRIMNFSFGTNGKKYEDIIIRAGGARKPFSTLQRGTEDLTGAIPKEDLFFMNGPSVFSFSVNITPDLIREILVKNNMEKEETDFFIFHQANRIILETILRKNKIPPEKSIIFLENIGNTVSSTIPFAMMEALEKGSVKPGNNVLLAAFGVGFSWGGTIVKV